MKTIFKNLRKRDYGFIAISLVLIVGQVWLELKSPDYMRTITTLIQQEGAISEILKNGGLMVACSIGSLLLSFVVGFFVAQIAGAVSMNMRSALYNKVSSFSKNEIHKFSTSSLITRCTNDVTQIQNIVAMGLQIIIKAPIMSVWAICKILGKSWQWSVATAVTVAVLIIAITIIIVLCLPKFKIIQKQTDDLNRLSRENLTGIRIIHAFNAEEHQSEKFEEVNDNLVKTQYFTAKFLSVLSPIMNLSLNCLLLAIYWIGAVVIDKEANIINKGYLMGDMIVFMTYAMLVISSFLMLVIIFMQLPRAAVSMRRINEVLKTNSSVVDGKGANTSVEGEIEFQDVSFRYPDGKEDVLTDINLKISKGETVAFIGATGCGKTTLVNLIPRFYDATSGKVLVDGVDVRDFSLKDLHDKVGYVSQKAILLSGTVASNVTMGKDIEVEDVLTAIKQAQAEEFVMKMDNSVNAQIYQSGKNISGGQKQRLSIARAIAKKPEFIIFDDSFSALDYKTDKKLRATLNKELDDTTCLIVAQRIGTIKNADKIVVLDDGKIVGVGKHEDLMANCEVYKQIALSQLSKEELL